MTKKIAKDKPPSAWVSSQSNHSLNKFVGADTVDMPAKDRKRTPPPLQESIIIAHKKENRPD